MFEILAIIILAGLMGLVIAKHVMAEEMSWKEWLNIFRKRFILWRNHREDYEYDTMKENFKAGGYLEYKPTNYQDITSAKKLKHIEKLEGKKDE